MDDRPYRSRWLSPVLGVFAAGLAHMALRQTGFFGAHDFAARAAITGAVAGVTALLVAILTNRRVTR
jgi:hypothetical protein